MDRIKLISLMSAAAVTAAFAFGCGESADAEPAPVTEAGISEITAAEGADT